MLRRLSPPNARPCSHGRLQPRSLIGPGSGALDDDEMMEKRSQAAVDLPTRRLVLVGLLAEAGALVATGAVHGQVTETLQARFLQWTRTATGFADVSPGTARAYIELAFRSGISPEDLWALEPGVYGATPIEKRLLESWYTGVFDVGATQVRGYDATLMWRAAGIDPPPSTCNSGPERWTAAPSKL
jgi:hypothetical protein